jgi:hypothetical protein
LGIYDGVSTDVKDAARIEAECIWRIIDLVSPGIPCNTIDADIATAELHSNFRKRHVKIARQEINAVSEYPLCQLVPEPHVYVQPLDSRGLAIQMHNCHDHTQTNMANVLFEVDSAHKCPRRCHFLLAVFAVCMVRVNIANEEFDACGHICSRGNQNTAFLPATNGPVFACRSTIQPSRANVSRDCGLSQSFFDFKACFRQGGDC